MGIKQSIANGQPKRAALLGVAAVSMTATVAATVVTPVPTPPALLAHSERSVTLTAASSPYQKLQDVVDVVLPALVNTFGAKPTVTLDSLSVADPGQHAHRFAQQHRRHLRRELSVRLAGAGNGRLELEHSR